MPDCPKCHVGLGFGFEGGLCPKCLTMYKWWAVRSMPGFDPEFIEKAAAIYAILFASGQLEQGITTVHVGDDGFTITDHKPLD